MPDTFRVALTRDFRSDDGTIGWGDIGMAELEAEPGVVWEYLDVNETPLSPGALAGYDGGMVLGNALDARSLEGADGLKVVARFGVGYATIDLDACTAAGVPVTITPDGTRGPMALAAVTLLLAIAHNVRQKDRIVRERRDWAERYEYNGLGLPGKTLGATGRNMGISGTGSHPRSRRSTTARCRTRMATRLLAAPPLRRSRGRWHPLPATFAHHQVPGPT